MGVTPTTRLALNKQALGDVSWGGNLNDGFDNADARILLTGAGLPSAVSGHYVGQPYYDTTNRTLWHCVVVGVGALSSWEPAWHRSADATAFNATTDAGDRTAPSLPTNFMGEALRLRHTIWQMSGLNGAFFQGAVAAPWYEGAMRSGNLLRNGRFLEITAGGGLHGWISVGSPTISFVTTNTLENNLSRSVRILHTAGSSFEGTSQTVSGLRGSQKYLVQARVRIVAGNAVVETTGGATNPSVADSTTGMRTIKGIAETTSTGTALVVRVGSTTASSDIEVVSVAVFEIEDTSVPFQNLAFILDSGTDTAALEVSNTPLYIKKTPGGSDMALVAHVPGPNYGIIVFGMASEQLNPNNDASAVQPLSWEFGIRQDDGVSPNDRWARRFVNHHSVGGATVLGMNNALVAGRTYTYKLWSANTQLPSPFTNRTWIAEQYFCAIMARIV